MADKKSDRPSKIDPAVLAKLKAFVRRLRKGPLDPSVTMQFIVRLLEIALKMHTVQKREIFEMGKYWLPPMSEAEIQEEKDFIARFMLEKGWSVRVAAKTAESIWPRPGRPTTKRHLARTAFDMWLANPQKSWMQVTREVCNCGKSAHDFQCKDQLLQQVKDLKIVMRKYKIPIPPRLRIMKAKQ